MLAFERACWQQGRIRLAGVDEAGRGPLAGPVVAAAVILEPAFAQKELQGALKDLTDSKKLSEAQREAFYTLLRQSPHATLSVGIVERETIDLLNILRATHLAMQRAIAGLNPAPDHILVDGRPVPGFPVSCDAIVGGDGKSLSIAAASVVAKVTRDHLMLKLDAAYPQYGFAKHKGYGTCFHSRALLEYGPCPAHRHSFRPVREAQDLIRRNRLNRSSDLT